MTTSHSPARHAADRTPPVGPSHGAAGPAPGDAGPDTAPPDRPRRRTWLFGVWAAFLTAFLIPSPGKMTFETKLGVAADPWRFLGDLGRLWQSRAGFGSIADQYAGYLFPMLPYYGLTDLARIPVWAAERLWLSLVVATAFWGALRLAERLRVGSPRTRLLGALCYALWPTFTVVVGSTSAAALPGALLPWVLLPLTSAVLSPRVAACRSALVIPFMGGVNAASTLASLLPVGLYLLTRTGRRRRTLLSWWLPGVVLATLWWTVPLLLLGRYGEDFMPYVESARTTTGTMSATEMLRGAGNWTAYLHFGEAWLPAGWAVATGALTVAAGALAAAVGLAGLARRDLPERRWLVLTVVTVSGIMLAGYGGALGGPFAETVQSWLDGPLRPFRNIYKFQPGLALALVLGIVHLIAVLAARSQARAGAHTGAHARPRAGGGAYATGAEGGTPGPRTFSARRLLPGLAALLLLPGLVLPYATGDILQPGAFKKLPEHWEQTAAWLEKNSPDTRAYVTPATAHGIYTWGSPIDQPLDVLAESPWAQRDYVPFGTPGNRRAMDAVEQALTSGGEVPGLRAFLSRAGLYHVVVRNDLDPDQVGYVPPQTVRRTLEASGYEKVESFGPTLTGGRIPAGTPLQVAGFYPRQRAVEIYEPVDTPRPAQAALRPVADTAKLSGGPEALLQLADDPRVADRPTVLTGDRHPGLGKPPLQISADGLRRADTRFGLVNTNTSYTYTAEERNHSGSLQNPGEEPKQILPTDPGHGEKTGPHQTVGVIRGAESVTASSSGNWLFHLPQFDPVGAFDGDPDTAWAEGSAGEPAGQWLRVAFEKPTRVPGSVAVTPLPAEATRGAPTRVRVETDEGSRTSTLRPDGTRQKIAAPAGTTDWLKVTIVDAQTPRPGLSGAGFSEIDIPGVQLTRLLKLPTDADDSRAESEIISLHRGTDPGGLSPAGAERSLHRRFTTQAEDDYALTARALPRPGPALDRLLDRVAPGSRNRITASADSTSSTGTSLSARNLVDGDLSTAWIAGSEPTVHLRWPGKKKIDEIVLAGAGGISARPQEVRISSPDGAATAGVDRNGRARFDPITTDRLDITVTGTQQLTVHNPVAGRELQLPVGLSEIHLPALEDLRVPPPRPGRAVTLPCGQGPPVSVDGTLHATRAEGTVRDLTERRPLDVRLCAGDAGNGEVALDAGEHTVESAGAGPLTVTDITLSRGAPATAAGTDRKDDGTAPDGGTARAERDAREVSVADWSGDRRTVRVGDGPAAYLQIHENVNEGWRATLDGEELTPLRLDGWQQGFLVPAGKTGEVTLEYEPARWYKAAFVAGGAGILLLLGLALLRRRGGTPLGEDRRVPPPGAVLGTLAVTGVIALAAGPYALVVPLLALLARFRPGAPAAVALTAMTGAGVVAVIGTGATVTEGQGAFSHPAQALALLALSAAVVTLPRPRPRHRDAPHPPDGAHPPTGTHPPDRGAEHRDETIEHRKGRTA